MADNFDRGSFGNKAVGFDDPVQLPPDAKAALQWQNANRSWWEQTPMRYDWRESIGSAPGTKEYYAEVDRRFLDAVRHYLPWEKMPFESLIPYAELARSDVLEIGVGQGTHAQLIAPRSKSFTGIDLTEAARAATQKRFDLNGIDGRIVQMDAEAMAFPNQSFDFIWSWGVIHHSANTQNVLREMHRVLRPGGRSTIMVYYRSPIQYYVINGLGRGLLHGKLWKPGGIHRVNQAATDGAIARFFSVGEFASLLDGLFIIEKAWVTGQKPDALPLPHGRLKAFLVDHLPDAISRFLTDRLGFGVFLIVKMRRL